jgi:hypothetical protein
MPVCFPALSVPGRVRFDTNASYYVKLFSNLSWNASFYGNWDNQPPQGFSGSDYGTSSGQLDVSVSVMSREQQTGENQSLPGLDLPHFTRSILGCGFLIWNRSMGKIHARALRS